MLTKKLLNLKLFFILLIFLWTLGIFSPCLIKRENLLTYHILKMVYSPVCHQNPERSFSCNHLYLMVCARCTGIYFGALVVSLLNLLPVSVSISKKFLLYSAIPMLIDIISINLGFYHYNKVIAFVTGNIFGASVFIFIFEVVKDYFIEISKD